MLQSASQNGLSHKKAIKLVRKTSTKGSRDALIEDSLVRSSLLTYKEKFMNFFSENITLNAGQHERAKTKSFSDIYTTKTTLKKFNFYVRENRQQEEIVAEAILGRGYTRAVEGRERNIKMHRGQEEGFIKIHYQYDGLPTVW